MRVTGCIDLTSELLASSANSDRNIRTLLHYFTSKIKIPGPISASRSFLDDSISKNKNGKERREQLNTASSLYQFG